MSISNKRLVRQVVLICGMLGVVFYFLHVIIGTLNYPGYDSFSQAVSDLTSDGSPSKYIARIFSGIYGLLSSVVSLGLFYLFRNNENRLLKCGIFLIGSMYLTSAIGYALFPLAESDNISDFQNIMHIVITILVVVLTIFSLILLILSFHANKEMIYLILSILTFVLLMLGAILTNSVSKEYFGLAERFSVFSAVIYLGVISYFGYSYKDNLSNEGELVK